MQTTQVDEHRQIIEPGGHICVPVAMNGSEMCRQLLMAIGISTLFGGRLVHLDGWLPGLILRVQALRSVENGDQIAIAHVWPDMYARLRAWIEAPADADALDLSCDAAHCVLVPNVFTWHMEAVAFTLRCVAGLPLAA